MSQRTEACGDRAPADQASRKLPAQRSRPSRESAAIAAQVAPSSTRDGETATTPARAGPMLELPARAFPRRAHRPHVGSDRGPRLSVVTTRRPRGVDWPYREFRCLRSTNPVRQNLNLELCGFESGAIAWYRSGSQQGSLRESGRGDREVNDSKADARRGVGVRRNAVHSHRGDRLSLVEYTLPFHRSSPDIVLPMWIRYSSVRANPVAAPSGVAQVQLQLVVIQRPIRMGTTASPTAVVARPIQ